MIRGGRFHISGDALYALMAVGLLLVVIFFKIPLPYVDASQLLFFTIVILLARSFLPSVCLGWIIGVFLILYVLGMFLSLPYASIIIVLLALFLILSFFSR